MITFASGDILIPWEFVYVLICVVWGVHKYSNLFNFLVCVSGPVALVCQIQLVCALRGGSHIVLFCSKLWRFIMNREQQPRRAHQKSTISFSCQDISFIPDGGNHMWLPRSVPASLPPARRGSVVLYLTGKVAINRRWCYGRVDCAVCRYCEPWRSESVPHCVVLSLMKKLLSDACYFWCQRELQVIYQILQDSRFNVDIKSAKQTTQNVKDFPNATIATNWYCTNRIPGKAFRKYHTSVGLKVLKNRPKQFHAHHGVEKKPVWHVSPFLRGRGWPNGGCRGAQVPGCEERRL